MSDHELIAFVGALIYLTLGIGFGLPFSLMLTRDHQYFPDELPACYAWCVVLWAPLCLLLLLFGFGWLLWRLVAYPIELWRGRHE